MKAGAHTPLTVDSLTLEGAGVGQLEGREVLCRGAFPGERAEVRIEAVSRQHPRAHARLLELALAHPARREAPCPNHERRAGRCAGCGLMELEESAQRDAKRLMLRDRYGLVVPHVEAAPAPLGYRYSSKRVAFARRGQLVLGSYAYGSHASAAMPNCLVDHPRLVHAFDALERAGAELAITPYDERNATGDLRYALAKTNGESVILTLVTAERASRVGELVPRLVGQVAGLLHSVQSARGNGLRGAPAELLHGHREVALSLLGQHVEVGALGFLQPNPKVAEAAYRALVALDGVPGRALAFDLYAGAGITTRALRAVFAEVVACESQPESAKALGILPETVETLLLRELTRLPRRIPDLVIANPPRKGLGAAACRALIALEPACVRIMSCGPEGLQRDLTQLAARYEVSSLAAFDTLPQTPHVELVATLRLRPPPCLSDRRLA